MADDPRSPDNIPPDDSAQNEAPSAPDAADTPHTTPTDIRADVPAPVEPEGEEFQWPTWEDDENPFTSGSRALVTLLAGAMLAYAQWLAPINPTTMAGWGQWVGNSFVSNFLLPLGIIWFFFGQTVTFQDWMKNQRHNAWTYGWDFVRWVEVGKGERKIAVTKWELTKWKRALKFGILAWAVLLPFLWYFSHQPGVKAASLRFMPIPGSPGDWVFLLSTLVLYMFCWEWFFRGFLLFGLAQGFTWVPAVVLQAGIFFLAHAGKSDAERWGSLAGGLILGVICWREKSFLPGFVAHALVHVTWAVLVLA